MSDQEAEQQVSRGLLIALGVVVGIAALAALYAFVISPLLGEDDPDVVQQTVPVSPSPSDGASPQPTETQSEVPMGDQVDEDLLLEGDVVPETFEIFTARDPFQQLVVEADVDTGAGGTTGGTTTVPDSTADANSGGSTTGGSTTGGSATGGSTTGGSTTGGSTTGGSTTGGSTTGGSTTGGSTTGGSTTGGSTTGGSGTGTGGSGTGTGTGGSGTGTDMGGSGTGSGTGGSTTGGSGTGSDMEGGNGGQSAPSSATVGNTTIRVDDIFIDDDGTPTLVVTVNGTSFEVAEGSVFADRFQLLDIDGQCATLLFGDSRFTLCEGESIVK